MPIQNWSESVVLVELSDDPNFSDDLHAVIEQCTQSPKLDVLLDFSAVTYLNSSNLAKILRLRKLVVGTNQRRLKLASVTNHVWGVFLVTGLDRVFDVVDDVPTGLAALQLG